MESVGAPSKLALVTRRLEADILARGLQPGESYLTLAEAAKLLEVSPATVHRAMQPLVRRQLLVRRKGQGTFIGEGLRKSSRPRVRTVYVLITSGQEHITAVQPEVLIDAVRAAVPDANVQFSFLPVSDPGGYCREVLAAPRDAGQLAGVIAVSCPREVCRYLGTLGVPVVVMGWLYGDERQVCVDIDHRRAGRLLAEHLVAAGHRRVALLMAGQGRPGDDALLDGAADALAAAGLPANALAVRVFPGDFEAFGEQVRALLNRTDRPSGVVCAAPALIPAVEQAAADLGLSLRGDVDLTFVGRPISDGSAGYAHARPVRPFPELAGEVAGLLRAQSEEGPSSRRVMFDVELVPPGRGGPAEAG